MNRLLLICSLAAGCSGGISSTDGGRDAAGAVDQGVPAVITVSVAQRTPRASTWSLGYWTWSPSYGAPVVGTEALIHALGPPFLRVAGYNNDANVPDPFNHAELDKAAAYAKATGSKLILQVPLIAIGPSGVRPTAADAAEMISYANVTRGYGIEYVSIGNEPDLYPDQGGVTNPGAPAIPGYTFTQYCTEARAFVAAIKRVAPAIQVVGPDLAYKYQASFDWLTPILQDCGSLFDVVAIHRYPYESLAVTTEVAAADQAALRAVIADVRQRMSAAGAGSKPLAITEANLAYIASPQGNPQGSVLGTVPHALWLADFLGASAELGLWNAGIYDIADSDPFSLGVVGQDPAHTPRPAYHAIALYAAHSGPTMLAVATTQERLRAYASRDAQDTTTHLVVTNWDATALSLTLNLDGLAAGARSIKVQVPALSVDAFEIPDGAAPLGWTYGEPQHGKGSGPEAITANTIRTAL